MIGLARGAREAGGPGAPRKNRSAPDAFVITEEGMLPASELASVGEAPQPAGTSAVVDSEKPRSEADELQPAFAVPESTHEREPGGRSADEKRGKSPSTLPRLAAVGAVLGVAAIALALGREAGPQDEGEADSQVAELAAPKIVASSEPNAPELTEADRDRQAARARALQEARAEQERIRSARARRSQDAELGSSRAAPPAASAVTAPPPPSSPAPASGSGSDDFGFER